jgi:hypothetical protein
MEAGMLLRVVGSGVLVMVSHIPAPGRVAVFVDEVVSSTSRVVWFFLRDVEVV